MTDEAAAQANATSCPWCSAELPGDHVETCPSCGAKLNGDAEAPGLTTIDSAALSRSSAQRRGGIISWITGEGGGEEETPAAPGAVAPPPLEVRREMLRMELEAEVAELQAEAGSLASEAREAGADEDEDALVGVAAEAADLREDVSDDTEPASDTATREEGQPPRT